MNLERHRDHCKMAEWHLQRMVSHGGEVRHRAICYGCGSVTLVSLEEAQRWEALSAVRPDVKGVAVDLGDG